MSSHQKFMSLGIDVSVLSLLSAFKIKIDTIDKGTKTCHRQLKAYVNANVCRHPFQQKNWKKNLEYLKTWIGKNCTCLDKSN